MAREKLIVGGLVVLAGLGFLVVKQAQRDSEVGKPNANAKDFPTISAPDDVDKVSITNGDKGEVVLEKKDDKWMVTKPVSAAANQEFVKGMLSNLKDLKVEGPAGIKLDSAATLKEKELDAEHGLHLIAWKGADKKVDEMFGKSGMAGQLMVVTDKPGQVWLAKGYQGYQYSRTASNWRDKTIFKFDDANASQVTIQSAAGTLSFTKGDKWAGTFKGAPIDHFDEDKVRSMMSSMKGLSADDFDDGRPIADTGLDHPEATITITLKDGAGRYELKVGKNAAGSSRYAMKSDDTQIFTLSQYSSDWITGGVSKYQKPVDAGVAPVAAAKSAPATKH